MQAMRSGLFWKLFLLQLLAAGAVLAGTLTFLHTFSVRGFAEYLESRERGRVQEAAAQIAHNWHGDLLAASEGVLRDRRHRPPEGGGPGEGPPDRDAPPRDAPPPGAEPPGALHHHPGEGLPPLQLQDAGGQWLRGDRREMPGERLREPIIVDGQTVGFLAWPRFPGYPEQAEFAHKQARHFAVIAPVAMVVAALFAALITALIVRPIRTLSGGAAALARREFGVRVKEDARDELGALAADFNKLAAALEGYDTRQRQWLADIAHELRTPLAVLRGEIEAMLDGVRPTGAAELKSLHEETSRLQGLIQDLHLLSLAESGGLRLNLERCDVGELLQQAAARFSERFAARKFTPVLKVEDTLIGQYDPQRMAQVFANVLENVLRHGTPGPVRMTARADGPHTVITVADAGPGVAAESLPRLFDRLYRVDSARARGTGGAGLGLSICKSIVEQHGGTISAQAGGNGGLDVVIRLPREAA